MATSPSHLSRDQPVTSPTLTAPTSTAHRIAFGRVIASEFPLHGLPAAGCDVPVSVRMRDSGLAFMGEPDADDSARFIRERHQDGVRYVAHGIGEFVISAGGELITYSLAPGASVGDVHHILTGPALVMALQLQGHFFLHGGAVERHGDLFAISAPHGFGKSTLTASFHRAGCTVVSDDVVPIREHGSEFVGGQGQPWIKLWDNALEAFGEEAARYNEVLDGLGKRIVPGVTAEGERPLRVVYLLSPHTTTDRPIEFRQLPGLDGALGLMANVYSPEIMSGELAARNLDFAVRLAVSVPVRVVSYYRSFDNLPNIRDTILRDFDEVMRA